MITVKNNILTFNYTSYKCSIGKNGITNNKREGDGCTPAGKYYIEKIFYRKDRIKLHNFDFKMEVIKNNYGWCDDPNKIEYNKLIKFPFDGNAELMYRNDNIYDIVCEINFNKNPIVKNKGSAIFLHIAKPNYPGTEGCIALKKADLINLLTSINNNTEFYISS
jgi:L,D-peptidoglycan transpeptidase YkuD (ErfK/YbiS/YcfS/YnhG family)|tara:strand:+ start:674 stop:1165 length:492 start_codon:yes stop_codon:yes gene_type:complete